MNMALPQSARTQACVVARLLQDQGHAPERVLAQQGLGSDDLRTPWESVPSARITGLWRTARELLGPDCGLLGSRYLNLASFQEVGYCALTAPTVLLGLKALANYFPLVAGNGLLIVEERDDVVVLTFHENPLSPICHAEVDLLFAALVREMARHCLQPIVPLQVELQQRGRSGSRLYRDCFGVQPYFGTVQDRMLFSRHDLMQTPNGANPDVYQRLHHELSRNLRSSEGSLQEKVSSLLMHVLPGGVFELEEIARRLGLSARTLQRRLAAEGVVFSALLEQARKDIALQRVKRGNQSIKEIAYTLGYADMNNFTRAFKRWFGAPPSHYRHQHRPSG